jgi:two-component system alkaline phosphatase synthesis response regulator PhoP
MKTILVVEDELSIRSFVCLNLRKKGYQVFEAENGEDALLVFKRQTIHVVLLDIMLPGIDGFTVCDEMRNLNPTAGIIMLTARAQDEDKVKGLLLGADDYLTKPFQMSELEARILSLLRRLSHVAEKDTAGVLISGPTQSINQLRAGN